MSARFLSVRKSVRMTKSGMMETMMARIIMIARGATLSLWRKAEQMMYSGKVKNSSGRQEMKPSRTASERFLMFLA